MKNHGLSRTRIYLVFCDMRSRCTNKNHHAYIHYGGRGITVCDEWMKDRLSFIKWAYENGYVQGLDLDRKDNNKGYSPENCRWVPRVVNRNNQRDTYMVVWNGVPIALADLCRIKGLDRTLVYQRIHRDGYSIDEAINKPLRNYPRKPE